MSANSKKCPCCNKVKDRDEFVNSQGIRNPRGRHCGQCYEQKEKEMGGRHFDGLLSAELEYIDKYKIIYGDDWKSKAWPSCLRFFLFMEREYCPYCGLSFKEYQERKDYFECVKLYHIDHMDPLELGGEDSIRNAVCICKRCNLRKGKASFLYWLERLPPKYKEISREIYFAKHGFQPEEFVQGESNVESRATGVYGLLTLDKETIIEMKNKNQLW